MRTMKTTVVGSYPIPAWLAAMPSAPARRDALLVVLKTQELAGIDLVTDGDKVTGVRVGDETIDADAVILACGGFEADDTLGTLAKRFADADLGRYTFKRFAVVGSAIVDFNCHNLGMAIMIDEEDAAEALAKRRDKSLESVGIRVMRIRAQDILENMDAVLQRITAGMRIRIDDKRQARAEHYRNSTPNRSSTGDRS